MKNTGLNFINKVLRGLMSFNINVEIGKPFAEMKTVDGEIIEFSIAKRRSPEADVRSMGFGFANTYINGALKLYVGDEYRIKSNRMETILNFILVERLSKLGTTDIHEHILLIGLKGYNTTYKVSLGCVENIVKHIRDEGCKVNGFRYNCNLSCDNCWGRACRGLVISDKLSKHGMEDIKIVDSIPDKEACKMIEDIKENKFAKIDKPLVIGDEEKTLVCPHLLNIAEKSEKCDNCSNCWEKSIIEFLKTEEV